MKLSARKILQGTVIGMTRGATTSWRRAEIRQVSPQEAPAVR